MNQTYTKQTDKSHIVKLDSALIYALWKCGSARGGAKAGLEVRTSFVGEGAAIEITVKGDDYGKITKHKDKIYGNRYYGEVDIPKKIKPGESVWFEVKLSRQGIKGESNVIPAGPPIELRRMQWDKKEARRGDVLKLTAELEGVEEGAEATVIIYEYDRDGHHDRIVSIPTQVKSRKVELDWEYRYEENVEEIPTDVELKKYGKSYNPPEYFFVVVIDGQRIGEKQESGLLEFKDTMRIRMEDAYGNPCKARKFTVRFADGSSRDVQTGDDGVVLVEKVPPGKVTIKPHPPEK